MFIALICFTILIEYHKNYFICVSNIQFVQWIFDANSYFYEIDIAQRKTFSKLDTSLIYAHMYIIQNVRLHEFFLSVVKRGPYFKYYRYDDGLTTKVPRQTLWNRQHKVFL